LDDFNREGLGIEVDFSLPAERVIRSLNRIIEWQRPPLGDYLQSPVSRALRRNARETAPWRALLDGATNCRVSAPISLEMRHPKHHTPTRSGAAIFTKKPAAGDPRQAQFFYSRFALPTCALSSACPSQGHTTLVQAALGPSCP